MRFQILIIALIVFPLMGCTANSELATSVQPVYVAPMEKATPTLTIVPITSPTLHPAPTVAAESTPESIQTPDPYGVVYAYSKSNWTKADRQDIREQLEYLQGLGINTIVQTFSSHLIGTGREKDWLILLDEAERVNIHVVARLWPLDDWTGTSFDFQTIQSFLDTVQNHPALLAYLGLHEPLEKYDSDQLREFYQGIKGLMPDLAIAHYMGSMAWFEESARFPNRDFSAGICDICIVWYYPVRYLNGVPVFEEDLFRRVLRENRKLVDERAPDTQLWLNGQTYSQREHARQLRMPTPEEMVTMYTIARQEQADGFLWYPWQHGLYDQVLSSPDMEAQRQAIRHIYENYVVQQSMP